MGNAACVRSQSLLLSLTMPSRLPALVPALVGLVLALATAAPASFQAPRAAVDSAVRTISPACTRAATRARALYDARADFAAAADAARAARSCIDDAGPTSVLDSASAATTLSLLSMEARARFNAEDWRGAAALGDVLARRTPDASPAEFGVALAHVGVARVYLGRASEGLADIGRAVRMVPEAMPREHAAVLRARVIAGERLADFDATDRAGAALVRFVDARVPPPHRAPMLLRALSDRASNLVLWHEHGGLPEPERRLGDGLALARAADSLAATIGDRDARAIARLVGADALLGLGRFDEAEASLWPLVQSDVGAFARWSLARLATRRGRFGEAVDRYREAIAEAGAQPDAHEMRYELACALESDGRTDEALAAYRDAIAALDAFTAATGSDEAWQRERAILQRPHRGLARLLARLGRPVDALVALDASRARLLLAARDRAQTLARDTPDGRHLGALLDDLAAARDRRVHIATSALPDSLSALDGRIEALRARLADASPLPRLVPLDVPALQSRLGKESRVLVAYLIDTPDAAFARESASLAFVVTADTVASFPLDTLGLGADLAAVGIPGDGDGEGMSLDALRRLHDRLVAPSRPFWRGAGRLTVVPDGALFALPFAALATRGAGFNYNGALFLVDEIAVSTDVAAGLVLVPEPVRPPARPGQAFAVVAGRGQFAGILPDLPGVAGELRGVRDRLPRVRMFEDDAATEDSVLAALRGARIWHVATHAAAGDALSAALYLAPVAGARNGDDGDGVLRLHELQSHALPLDLAVLSGCETARGDLVPGEGMAGLQSGLRAAGARSVVATLWRVPDGATANLMGAFYDALLRGERRDDALRDAQRAVRRLSPDPATWAAPVLYGDTRALDLPALPPNPARPYRPLLLVIVLALTAVAVVASRRRFHRP